MRPLLALLFLLCVGKVCFGQSFYDISGRITNKDNMPISGSHIYLHGTNIGTVSNAQGFFRLKIPAARCHSNVIFSHVGFVSTSKKVICGKQDYLIMLSEHVKELGEIEVLDMSAEQIVEKVILNLYKNYQVDSVNYQIFGRYMEQSGNEPILMEEYVFNLYHDDKTKPEFNIIKIRGLGFNKLGKQRFDGARLIHIHISDYHIMLRFPPLFLEKKKMKKYKYELVGEILDPTGSYYVINIISNKRKKYERGGTIHVNKEDFGIRYLKNTYKAENWRNLSKKNVIDGNYYEHSDESYYVKDEGKWYFSNGTIKQTYPVKRHGVRINTLRRFVVINRTAARPFKKSEEMGLMVQMLRDFTSDFNDDFWEAYNYIPLDKAFERALINAKIP